MLHAVLSHIWNRLQGLIQWHLLWLIHDKFMIGVAGVVLDDQQRVLLLKHRYRPAGQEWGLPSGYANKNEPLEETLGREVWEEVRCKVAVTDLLQVVSGYRLRLEVFFVARFVGGTPTVDQKEVLEADFFPIEELPDELPIWHKKMIEQALAKESISESHYRVSQRA